MEDFILNKQMPQVLDKIIEVLEFSSIHTSIWITVPLTIDRYIAVCHPLKYHTVSYPARTRKVIVSVYITCFLTSIPYYWWPNIWIEDYISTSMHHVLIWTHCFTVYLVPCSIFFILNSIIVYKLRRKSNFRLRGYSTGKTTAILFTITSIFAILWAPRIIMILYHLYVSPINNSWVVHIVSDIANMLALLNTAINFFLYCFISKRFRTMAAATLKAFFKCQKQPVQFYTNHNFSITSSPWISPANSHCIKMLVYQYDKNGKPIKISPWKGNSWSFWVQVLFKWLHLQDVICWNGCFEERSFDFISLGDQGQIRLWEGMEALDFTSKSEKANISVSYTAFWICFRVQVLVFSRTQTFCIPALVQSKVIGGGKWQQCLITTF